MTFSRPKEKESPDCVEFLAAAWRKNPITIPKVINSCHHTDLFPRLHCFSSAGPDRPPLPRAAALLTMQTSYQSKAQSIVTAVKVGLHERPAEPFQVSL